MKQFISPKPIVHYLLDILRIKPGNLPDRAKNSWNSLFLLADCYNIYHYLAAWSLEKWGEVLTNELKKQLRKSLIANLTRNTLLSKQIVKLNQLFKNAEIPIIFIKGAAGIVRSIYPLEQRYLCDLDVLVPTNFIEKSRQLFQSVGYMPDHSIIVPPHHHHIESYCHPNEVGSIEIHIEPYDESILDSPVMPNIWNDGEIIKFFDGDITVPSISDHAWILMRSSGSGRMFLPRLKEAVEMTLIIKKNYSINYGLLIQRAENDNMPNIVKGMSYSCSQYMGITPFVNIDEPLLEHWENWSLKLQRKLVKNAYFKASRKRFGAMKFLTNRGVISKIRFFTRVVRYEFLADIPDSRLLKSFSPLIKLWRVVKNILLLLIFLVEYSLFRVFRRKASNIL